MPPQLVAMTEGPNIVLDKPILLLGRHQDCDVQIGSRKVSRRHCCLAQINGFLMVRDLGSTNGIRINGVRVQEGSLRAGDELTIGSQRYQLEWASRAAEQPPLQAVPHHRNGVQPPAPVAELDENFVSCDIPVALPEPGTAARPPAEVNPVPTLTARDYDDSHRPPIRGER